LNAQGFCRYFTLLIEARMRLTTKGRFAVTAMIDLALRQGKGPVTLSGISQRQAISLSYLESSPSMSRSTPPSAAARKTAMAPMRPQARAA
jgi:hypothetical protein